MGVSKQEDCDFVSTTDPKRGYHSAQTSFNGVFDIVRADVAILLLDTQETLP